jgi:hypothetical protein
MGQKQPPCAATNSWKFNGQFCYAARSTRTSISLRNVPKSIGLVSSASATYHPWNKLGHSLDKLVELDGGEGCKAVGDPVWKQ